MKLFNILTAGLLLCAGLASCEMKDELKGSGEGSSEVGYLNLGVAVNASQNNVSRADVDDDGENVGVSVSADDFPVIITGVTDPSYSKEYESYAALKAENEGKVELPVGEYTVTAHSDAELQPQMAAPYYEGTASIKITAGVESSTNVECTMKNTKIQLTYTSSFLTKFESWDITVSDGSSNNLMFDETEKNPAAIYWLVAENVSEIKVNITAVPQGGGQAVTESRILTKPAGGNSNYWTGADALTIQMNEQTSEDPTGIQGSNIVINASVSFNEEEEDVQVPVKPGDDVADDNKPTVSGEYLGQTITFSKSANNCPNIEVLMTAPNKIQNVYIKATTTDKELENIFTGMGFMTGTGVDLVAAKGTELDGLISPLPTTDDTSYTFTLGALAGFLTVGEHSFTVTVVDQKGLSSEPATLKFTVTE